MASPMAPTPMTETVGLIEMSVEASRRVAWRKNLNACQSGTDNGKVTVYFGKLQLGGDAQTLPAVVRVEMGSIKVSSGETEIGEWKLYQVSMSELDQWVVLGVEGENLYLDLKERARFLDETSTYHKEPSRARRRQLEHPAFRKDEPEPTPGPSPADRLNRLRGEVSQEAAPLIEEGRELIDRIPLGWKFYSGLAAILVIGIFVPVVAGALFVVLMGVGVLAVLAGGIGYAEPAFGVRFPNSLSPTRVMLVGGVSLLASIPFALLS